MKQAPRNADRRDSSPSSLLTCYLGGAALLLWASTSTAAPESASRPAAAAFAAPPRMSNVRLSYDGRFAAWFDLGSIPERIIVYDLVNGKDRRVFLVPDDTKLRSLDWADDDTLIYTVSATIGMPMDKNHKFEIYRTFSADLTTGNTHMFFANDVKFEFITGSELLATHTSTPKTAIVWALLPAFYGRGGGTGVFRINTQTGNVTQIDSDPRAFGWIVDPDGNPVAKIQWHQNVREHEYEIFAKRGAGWTRIYERSDGLFLTLYGLNEDQKSLIAVGPDKDGRSKLLTLPLDGSEPKVVYDDPDHGVAAAHIDPMNGRLIAVSLDGADSSLKYLDEPLQKRLDAVRKSFPGLNLVLTSSSADGSKLVVNVSAPDKPPTYYLIDYTTHKAAILGEAYPALANVKLGSVKSFTYAARDGTQIPAYLTTPADVSTTSPMPLVVLPHGGPEARDFPVFDYLAQFIASRGYLVLQPQFRGSTGFGEAFREAGWQQWGGLMQDDVTDGVKAMIEQHVADPKRICIMGWSYGGYAALAGAAFTPELYRCAISIGGVTDLQALLLYEERHIGQTSKMGTYLREHMGSVQDPKLAEKSPARHPALITAPILLIHAADDSVVPPEQAEIMSKALNAANKQVTIVKITGDDHWLSNAKTRVQAMEAVDAFLKLNLPN